MVTQVRKSKHLTLSDRLSRLTMPQAIRLLGGDERGRKLLYAGGKISIVDLDEQVSLVGDLFRLSIPEENVIVTITQRADQRQNILLNCDECDTLCEHMGAALSLVLDSKMALGLAKAPDEREPVEALEEEQLVAQALAERAQRANEEKMVVKAIDASAKTPWTDYLVTSRLSGKSYRVALRGFERGESYCTCPDFRVNTLGTCKHILNASRKIEGRFNDRQLKKKPRQREVSVYLRYGIDLALQLGTPDTPTEVAMRIIGPIAENGITDVRDLVHRIDQLEGHGESVVVYPDAEEFIQRELFKQRVGRMVGEIRRDPRRHPLRKGLLKVELLPYQVDGIAFAVGAGRAILADDMGLGKTIQGVGVAELLAREVGIERVLVVCPTSLKSQWRNEVRRFSDRTVQVVAGRPDDRAAQYQGSAFFTICNYEQVLRDIMDIERVKWDLIILDEGQRIKNWEAQTTRIVKSLRSRFALVLSGTPLENRLDELYSVVQFIDGRHLGPGFRFFNRYRTTDAKGKVLGYQHLDELREKLKPILLRRTRDLVLKDLPPRNTEIVRIPPTDEQRVMNATYGQIIASIVRKKFISEMDLIRLRQALQACRMAADSTFLVDKQLPGYSSKLEHLDELFEQLFVDGDHKAVVFSEWTRMLDLIEPLLTKRGVRFVRLEGKIPQTKRQQIVNEFQNDRDCRVFLTTNAGSTGLNLQAADTVVNVDLPWNPAVLEQRIARAHRMGQDKPVNVFILVTEQTLEENLLQTLSQKKELSIAALDYDSDITEVDLQSGMDELKSRLEVLLGAVPEAPVDESMKHDAAEPPVARQRKEAIANAGGQMLTAAFSFLGQMLPGSDATPNPDVVRALSRQLAECAETDAEGHKSLRISLPSDEALTQFAENIARLLNVAQQSTK